MGKRLVKGKIVQEENKSKLSMGEIDIAQRLAIALESYDPGDPRNEKFLNFPLRKEAEVKKAKNFLEMNLNKFNSHLSNSSLVGKDGKFFWGH
jgi:hypothetical protein